MLSGAASIPEPGGDDVLIRMRSGRRRTRERGFTFIELVISLGILGIVIAAIAAAFGVGVRALAPGGAQARLAGAHDLAFLEQLLGKDGARASCITAGGPTVYGANVTAKFSTCSPGTGYGQVPGCTAPPYAALCLGWPQYDPTSGTGTCHVAVYTKGQPNPPATPAAGQNVVVTRTEYSVPYPFPSPPPKKSALVVDRFDTVQFQVGVPVAYTPANESYTGTWVRSIPVTITATGVSQGQFSQTLALHPVATDPGGASSAITAENSPC